MSQLVEIKEFLPCETPQAWLHKALDNIDLLLIDHAHCEQKAASAAISLTYRYAERSRLLIKMAQLAREELLHFEQVLQLMKNRGIAYRHIAPSRYASGLRALARTYEPARFVDILIIAAFVEARSCERFERLAPHLDAELARFYRALLRSEVRHYKDYLALAEYYSDEPITARIALIAQREQMLIESPDQQFRFHSGVPA